jgi:Macrocin-O-methyltransferase (TylF)
MNESSYSRSGLQLSRNTTENIAYYDDLTKFFREDGGDDLLRLRSFAMYSPRQVVSDFLARYELFRLIRDVHGSILEFGVFNGQGLMSFAHFSAIHEPNNLTREIIGFDTFSGFPDLSDQDRRGNAEIVKPGGLDAASYDRLQKAIALFDRNRFLGHVAKIRLVRGNVMETLDHFLDENGHLIVALLYLDLDLYEPTKFVLERLIKRVPKGGIIAFDELNHRSFPGETAALLDVVALAETEIRRVPFCSRISYVVR